MIYAIPVQASAENSQIKSLTVNSNHTFILLFKPADGWHRVFYLNLSVTSVLCMLLSFYVDVQRHIYVFIHLCISGYVCVFWMIDNLM